jgi:hypothetical protein
MRQIRYPVPALKVARLATSSSFQSRMRGTGSLLMRLSYNVGLQIGDKVGCRLITLDADPEAVAFYEHLGFTSRKPDKKTRQTPMYIDLHRVPKPDFATARKTASA